MKEQIILEKNLDFRQFQNLIILTFVTLMMLLGFIYSEEFEIPITAKIVLALLNVLFIAILFTKKGLGVENSKLYSGVFLFGFVLQKKVFETSNYQELSLRKGKLSTNYAYTNEFTNFKKWEPNLNVTEESFTLVMKNEDNHQKIIMMTESKKVKSAIDFIIKHTHLSY